MGRDSFLIVADDDLGVLAEQAIDILQSAVCSFGVEEVDNGNESGIEDDPDDIETPLEGLNAYRGNLDH